MEGAAGDGAPVGRFSLEGAAGDGAPVVVVHIPLEGAAGDGAVVGHSPLEGAVGDGALVGRFSLEGAAGDGAPVGGPIAGGAALKFGRSLNKETRLQCACCPGLRGGLQGEGAGVQEQGGCVVVPMGNVTLACGIAFGVQIDGNAFGGVVLCVQITAAAGGGFLLGAAGGVGLLYKGCSLFGRGLGGCIEHRGSCQCRHRQQGQQHTAGQQDAYNAFGFHKISLLSCGFYTGCRYHKYTTNWAKIKEILREWGLKLREWLKKARKVVHIIIKLPQSSLRDARFPFLSPAVTSSPGAGEVILWDGAFGIVVQFPAKVQSLRARQRLPPRGSWQNRQALTEGVSRAPSQALPRQIPPFVTYGDIFPRSGGSLSSQGEPSRQPRC